MRLTAYTDYALRTLIFLAMHREELVTIQQIADAHGIPKNHLSKVVHQLGLLGYVATTRGRNGGLKLGHEPADINIGDVVRQTEPDFYMAACFDEASAGCMYAAACGLKGALASATAAFLAVLEELTLEQVVVRETRKKRGPAKGDAGMSGAVALHFKPPRKR